MLWAQEHQRIVNPFEYVGEDIALPAVRETMRAQTRDTPGLFNYGVHAGARKKLYRIRERCAVVV